MNTYEKLEYYGKKHKYWQSVGDYGFYERERRTRVIDKSKNKPPTMTDDINGLKESYTTFKNYGFKDCHR
jgi:hypothetical protein